MKVKIDNYFSYFFPSVILFSFINVSIAQIGSSLIVNETYLKKIYLPKTIFPLNSIATELVTLVMNLAAIISIGIIIGKVHLQWELLLLPLYLLPAALFALGVGLILSVSSVFFRDLTHVVPLLMQAIFYITPILYDPKILPPALQNLNFINPFYYFIIGIRVPFGTEPFSANILGLTYLLGFLSLTFGLMTIKHNENKIIFKL
jgi:ABC-2 type transport system permease protein/lipopolysaccharide transport system permease protein